MYQRENILRMDLKAQRNTGMDVIIVSTNTPQAESFWQKRLEELKGTLIKPSAMVIAVFEDWTKGAGNGLGSLYAFQKAREKASQLYHQDLYHLLAEGAAIALYQTAGKGSRLTPLTSSEYNDKSAIKLPGFIDKDQQMTMIEAVIKQTCIFSNSRRGRLSVFWGDQLFIPSKPVDQPPSFHIDIFARKITMPTEREWTSQRLHNYGLIFIHDGEVQNIDKSDYSSIKELVEHQKVYVDRGVGLSLGSFSLSAAAAFALLSEFEQELKEKRISLDSDPYFWMPLTLDETTYVDLLVKKNTSAQFASEHYERMTTFKKKLILEHPSMPLIGVVDIGKESYCWDYGTTRSYFENCMKLIGTSEESELMRLFFHDSLYQKPEQLYQPLKINEQSCVVNSRVRSGKVVNSLLINVHADHIEAENCVIMNSVASKIYARHSLIYNVLEDSVLELPEGSVRADCYLPEENRLVKLQTLLSRDGKMDWNVCLPGNRYSYEEIYLKNRNVDYTEARLGIEAIKQRLFQYIQSLSVF